MGIKVVGSGIDTLVLGYLIARYLDVDDFKILSEAKEKASERQFNSNGSSVTWFDVEFIMSARGTSGYEWVLRNADVKVCIARDARGGSIMPEVYVTFSSQYLWCEGVDDAVSKFEDWLKKWALVKENKVSRCDLCIDLAMPFTVIDLKNEIVSRARGKVEYSETLKTEHYISGRHDTGYRIGSGALLVRIYDKTAEIMVTQKEWFRDVWLGEGWDSVNTVIRCEFQLRRELLKEMGVNTFEDLRNSVADIWRYCTHDWVRICNVGSATNQARWKCKEFWKIVQNNYSLFGHTRGVIRMKVKRVMYKHLMKLVRGVLVSACAVLASGLGLPQAEFKLKQDLRDILQPEDFRKDVIARKALFGNMERPSNHLVDEAIRLGAETVKVDWSSK